jgi:cholesterol transport system auxiliary component
MRRRFTTLLLLTLLLLLAGCSSRTIQSYTLAPGSVPHPASPYRQSDIRVEYPKGIEDTMSSHIYFTRSDLTQSHYLYSQWSQPLNRLVMAQIIATLQRSHLFRHVLDYASEAGSDYLLETTIYRFRHRITPEGSFADVSIGVRLLRTADRSLVKSRRFDYEIPCPSTDARGFVQAANEAMQRLGRDLVQWLAR